jgi:hypothetical protein
MASQVLGLFTSPQQYQQQQQDVARQRAMEFARLNPFEQASASIGQGSYNLAGAIGGALGGQDPQLQKITMRQQLIGMIDPSNPDSYAQAIQAALQTGDQEAAYLLRNEMMKVKQVSQEEQLNQMKVQDYLTQRGQGMQAAGLTNMANELVGQLKNPDGTINEDVKAKLLSFPQGRAAISEQAKILPDLRQLGASSVPETNPFDLFINDPTVPAALKTTAKQYQSSFAKGIYSPEQADKLIERLSTATQKATEFQQTQDRLKQNQEMLDSYRQQGLSNSQASLNLQRQQAELNNDFKRQKIERDAEIAKNKPLPANLAKSEEDDYDIAASATNLATDANAYINRIKSGDIKFGLKNKASIATRGALGSSDPDVIARQDFDKFIERMTSENLRLNKGVQTDKDFERELKLLKSAESAASAEQIMQNLVKINVRKVQDARSSIERRRVNAGLGMPVVPIATPQFGERPPLSNFETTNTNPMGTTGGRR